MKRLFYLLMMVCILLTSCSFQEQPEEKGLPPVTVSGGSIHVQKKLKKSYGLCVCKFYRYLQDENGSWNYSI